MYMKMTTALNMANLLLGEVIEEVDANYGSPPFPNQQELIAIEKRLNEYIMSNREAIDRVDEVCRLQKTAVVS